MHVLISSNELMMMLLLDDDSGRSGGGISCSGATAVSCSGQRGQIHRSRGRRKKKEEERMTSGSHLSLSSGIDLGAQIWVLLLE